eukprot:8980762-Pyramimonas_sp.AAC.1
MCFHFGGVTSRLTGGRAGRCCSASAHAPWRKSQATCSTSWLAPFRLSALGITVLELRPEPRCTKVGQRM